MSLVVAMIRVRLLMVRCCLRPQRRRKEILHGDLLLTLFQNVFFASCGHVSLLFRINTELWIETQKGGVPSLACLSWLLWLLSFNTKTFGRPRQPTRFSQQGRSVLAVMVAVTK